jgi:UDP-N-acetylmuramyl pentapeptide phosphotransferase/UDP-N-acetylglucosamine-1-phosphate transferase
MIKTTLLSLAESPLVLIITAAIAMTVAALFIPVVLRISRSCNLTDKPGPRKVHILAVPRLGGVGIFVAFSISYSLMINGFDAQAAYFSAALLMLFFTGITDDLIHLPARKKLIVQVIASLVVIILADIRFTSLHGFLGIYSISPWISVPLTLFVMIVIINALNLIDGIDGLAASLSLTSLAALGCWFWSRGMTENAVVAAAMAGALIVFLYFNMSKGYNKIFMGDSGSLVLGFVISVLVIRFNEVNAQPATVNALRSAPAVSIAILIIPLFDTLRVVIVRLIRGQNPFRADKRHIHHLMLRAGFSHRQGTLILSLFQAATITLAFVFDSLGIITLSVIMLAVCYGLTLVLTVRVRKRIRTVTMIPGSRPGDHQYRITHLLTEAGKKKVLNL